MTALTADVSRETLDKLKAYEDLIQKWSPKINLVAKSTLTDLWVRHIEDSAQVNLLAAKGPAKWTDLGSGGGLPGIVISILRQTTNVVLIESDQRKATFLRTCIRTLDLNARVIADRIENASPTGAQVVSARALAPLPLLLEYVHRHLAPTGIALLSKGKMAEQELADARKTWSFEVEMHRSLTNPDAYILQMDRISRA